jgi:hypothetical protein
VSERCETCRFWTQTYQFLPEEYPDDGHCTRYPHMVAKAKADWCGEWKAKAEPDGEWRTDWENFGKPAKAKERAIKARIVAKGAEFETWEYTFGPKPEPAKPAPREPGWYWVQVCRNNRPTATLAELEPYGRWSFAGYAETLPDEEVTVLDERRIVRGE